MRCALRRFPSEEEAEMRKLMGVLLAVGLVLAVPSSAGGSSVEPWGYCVHTRDGRVGFDGGVFAYEYDYLNPVRWIYRARPVDSTRWFEAGGFRQIMDVGLESYQPPLTDGGNADAEFHGLRFDLEGMVVRLDLLIGTPEQRYQRLAYYNDATMDPKDCRSAAEVR
jgi:hypothetical protein